MTVSIWQRQAPSHPAPDRVQTDVAIIGGGVCGLSAAIEAEAAGADCILVERDRVASGASGRNAGYLMRGLAESYAVAADALGRDTARAVWAWSEDNLRALRNLGASRTPGFADRPSCLIALDEPKADELDRSAAMLAEDGFDATLIEPDDARDTDAIWRTGRVRLGLLNPHDAVCHPVELLEFLRSMLKATRVAEGTEVYKVETDDRGVTIRCRGLVILAKRALVATNAWASELIPHLRGVVQPRRGQMLAAEAGSAGELRYAYYLNRGNEYIRTGPGGELLVGGARQHEPDDEAGDHGGIHPDVQQQLERWMRELVAPEAQVIARWSGVMGFSPRGLPLVGPALASDERLWVCAGFTGHGMSLGHLAGRRTMSAMLGLAPRPALFDTPTPQQ